MGAAQWGQLGMQVAGNTANTAMGMLAQRIGANYDRKQQLKTQKQMMDLQMPYNLAMMKSQKDMDYDMWLKTGIGGQMEQMKKAGINPGLLLGMSGAGGATVGGSSGGMSAPNAGVIPTGMGMEGGINMADIQLKASQARLNNVQADKIGGVDTENTKADTGLKLANTGNTQADTALKKVETNIANLEMAIKNDTQGDVMDRIRWEAKRSYEAMEQLRWDNALSKEQFDDKVEMLGAELAGVILRNAMTKAGTENIKADTKNKGTQNNLIQAQTASEIAKRLQGWRELGYEEQKLEMHKYLTELGIAQNEQKMIIGTVMDVFNLGTKHKEDKNYSEYESGQTYDDGSYERKRTRRY